MPRGVSTPEHKMLEHTVTEVTRLHVTFIVFLLILIFLMIREIRYELKQKGYKSGKDSLLSKNRIRPNMARVIEP